MEKITVKFWLDVFMAISFILVGITGILKMPLIVGWTIRIFDFGLFSKIHDWAGITLVMLIIIHLFLNWAWIRAMIFKGSKEIVECN